MGEFGTHAFVLFIEVIENRHNQTVFGFGQFGLVDKAVLRAQSAVAAHQCGREKPNRASG